MARPKRSRAIWLAFLIICVMNIKNGIADLCLDNAIFCDPNSFCNTNLDGFGLPSCTCFQGHEKDEFGV
ncbi:unnamed protein product, partial [Owenia fusiformis]